MMIIMSTRLDLDTARELKRVRREKARGGRNLSTSQTIRELVQFALISRHQFRPIAKLYCRECSQQETHSVHYSSREIKSQEELGEQLGIPASG